MTNWNEEQGKGEQIQRGWADEVSRLRAEIRHLERLIEDAGHAFDDIVDAERAEGNRNSYPAQVARGAARKLREPVPATGTAEEPK